MPAVPRAMFLPLPPPVLAALVDGDLARAARLVGRPLPAFFADEGWLWRLRLDQVREDPTAAAWVVRALVVEPDGVVGHAGFHGPPDEQGAVEVAYTVDPERRGRGYARAALRALVEEAEASGRVRVVRASVSPDNAASLAVVRGHGFVHVGEQVDEVDGLELVFERQVAAG